MRELKSAYPVKPAQESSFSHESLSPFTAPNSRWPPKFDHPLLFISLPTTPALLFPSLRPSLLNHQTRPLPSVPSASRMNLDVTKIVFFGARSALFSFRGDSLSDPANSSLGDGRSDVQGRKSRRVILLRTLCRFQKSQVLCNQANPPSFSKTPGMGSPPTSRPPNLQAFRRSDPPTFRRTA